MSSHTSEDPARARRCSRIDGLARPSSTRLTREDVAMNEINRTNDALVGFVCGAALGAGVALLLAPAKGAETRRRLGETARRLRNTVNNRLERVRSVSRVSEMGEDRNDAIATGRVASAKR